MGVLKTLFSMFLRNFEKCDLSRENNTKLLLGSNKQGFKTEQMCQNESYTVDSKRSHSDWMWN